MEYKEQNKDEDNKKEDGGVSRWEQRWHAALQEATSSEKRKQENKVD
jgi:hypothetical protein